MRSGRTGTASEVSAAAYFSRQSRQMPWACSTQALRRPEVSALACASMRASVTLASPSTAALSG